MPGKDRVAVILVALPGMGKTAIGTLLARTMPNAKKIEQDDFYKGRVADHQAYLHAVRRGIRKQDLVLCKNHHTAAQRHEVLAIARRSGARVIIANLVPPGLASMTEEERDVHLDRLLDRIEGRHDGSSHLVIDAAHSRARARQVIKHAFWKTYEEPSGTYLQLDYTDSVAKNADAILQACLQSRLQ
jgi:hypothetical protein